MRTSRRLNAIIATAALTFSLAFTALPAMAVTPQIVPDCATNQGKDAPGLECVEKTFLNIASLIVAVTGSFALLMFVYGGFMLILSNGVSAKVELGKTIIRNAVIGIILIFLGGYVIDYLQSRLTAGQIKTGGASQTCAEMGRLGYTCMTDPSKGRDCSTYAACAPGACCIPMTASELQEAAKENAAAKPATP